MTEWRRKEEDEEESKKQRAVRNEFRAFQAMNRFHSRFHSSQQVPTLPNVASFFTQQFLNQARRPCRFCGFRKLKEDLPESSAEEEDYFPEEAKRELIRVEAISDLFAKQLDDDYLLCIIEQELNAL